MARTPSGERGADGGPREDVRGRRVDRAAPLQHRRRQPVERPAEPVEDAPEQALPHPHLNRRAGGDDGLARADAGGVAERHEQDAPLAEADDLGLERGLAGAVAGREDLAALADAGLGPLALDHQADQLGRPAR